MTLDRQYLRLLDGGLFPVLQLGDHHPEMLHDVQLLLRHLLQDVTHLQSALRLPASPPDARKRDAQAAGDGDGGGVVPERRQGNGASPQNSSQLRRWTHPVFVALFQTSD